MSVTKLNNGKWQARVSYKDDDGNYKSVTHLEKRKTDAVEWETKTKNALLEGADLSRSTESLKHYFLDWIRIYKTDGVSRHTHELYMGNWRHVSAYFKDKPMSSIKRPDYQKFLNEFGRSHGIATSHKLHQQVHTAIKDAVADGILKRDFAYKAHVTGRPPKPVEEKYLTLSDYKKLRRYLIKTADYDHMTMLMMLFQLETGTRFEEAAGLTWDNLDLNNGIVHIKQQWDARRQTFRPTKGNGQADGDITIGPAYCRFMRSYRSAQKDYLELHEMKNPKNLVFWSKLGKIVGNGNANEELGRICNRLKINKVTTHAMRHTHASILILNHESLPYVQHRLRHQKLETTVNTYVHLIEEENGVSDKKATELMDEGF
ncbi:prophage Lp2 protein 2, integrase [Lactiplantibacillus plantarum]|nr:site-specific integrase [Lactiplantibacillus plantarum]MCG0635264.1 prophage Lp2 protein 2, integrase [Lactiplantibacillus plantarum]MCG0641441.1 prophage Lp2 protein 2, integrase [Lactiplantibacillus plantarum]MCG0644557.1 prophage Lp2 protein 2, integrase [Lactiplantibacillus plantarum]MCG0650868.1 prophage Lp2 protein 2, integrase [Lactiplantibacillus plantarum]